MESGLAGENRTIGIHSDGFDEFRRAGNRQNRKTLELVVPHRVNRTTWISKEGSKDGS